MAELKVPRRPPSAKEQARRLAVIREWGAKVKAAYAAQNRGSG